MGRLEQRDRFAALLEEEKAVKRSLAGFDESEQGAALHTKLEAGVIARFRERRPKARKVDFKRAREGLTDEEFEAIKAPLQAEANGMLESLRTLQRELDEQLREVAAVVPVEVSDERQLYYVAHEITYRSVGSAASHYAKASAQMQADHVRRFVPASDLEIVREEERGRVRFEVWVRVGELDIEVLRRKPALPLDEQVRRCWELGTNPRVFNPWLPPDYEDQHGLDRFGGRKDKSR